MDKDAVAKQAEDFKDKYGKYPQFPIRVNYTWCAVQAQGDIKPSLGGYAIFGYPGMVPLTDENVQDLVMLHDGQNKPFPNAKDEFVGQRIVSVEEKPETETEPKRQGVPPKPPVKKIKPGEEK